MPVKTLFIGGGTPTHLKPRELGRFLELATSWLKLDADAEFTVEANPADCDQETLATLAAAKVNRISLGGQSFSQRKLKLLERDHGEVELKSAIAAANQHFREVSLDLIFGTPSESAAEWRRDLEIATSLPITHLSTYGLTIERGSAFFSRAAKNDLQELPSEDQLEQYELTIDTLQQNGWDHYEVSSFAKPGSRCRHNLAYWQGRYWWGFGPGAASFLPAPQDSSFASVRRVNHRSTTTYLRRVRNGQSPVAEEDHLTEEQTIRERLVFGLRQIGGLNLEELEHDYGSPLLPLFEPYLTRYLELGFLIQEGSQIQLSRQGLLISDSLWPDLLGDIE